MLLCRVARYVTCLVAAGGLVAMGIGQARAVQINEIRIDQPGGDRSDAFDAQARDRSR